MAESNVPSSDQADRAPRGGGRVESRGSDVVLARSLLYGIVYASLLFKRASHYPNDADQAVAGAELAATAADTLWDRVNRGRPNADGKRALDNLAGRAA